MQGVKISTVIMDSRLQEQQMGNCGTEDTKTQGLSMDIVKQHSNNHETRIEILNEQ
jgi:hypothetical protein